jgi:MFS family permease
MAVSNEPAGERRGVGRKDVLVVGASSAGAVFEWYDFFLYGAMAVHISRHFFAGVNDTTSYILALLTFAAGFAIRPLGAIVFGRLGDLWGRKNTFLVTMLLMGVATFSVGLLPSYEQIGVLAPIAVVTLRLIQGLAMGGEYGGAAIYIAEHAPARKVGLYTSWIQTTGNAGLFLSLAVILGTRLTIGEAAFSDWGWRLPFLASALLLVVSLWIRLQLRESPIFEKMVAEGTTSKAPLTESFARWPNLRLVLIALFGLTAGQAVVWYTGQFYALFFLEKMLKLDGALTNMLMGAALLIGTPGFVFFGWLSDRIGRKPIIVAGFALAALTFFPIFKGLTVAVNPDLAAAVRVAPVTVTADPTKCSFQFDPVGKQSFDSSCDVAKAYLAKAGIPYDTVAAPSGTPAVVSVGAKQILAVETAALPFDQRAAAKAAWGLRAAQELADAGYPLKADPAKVNVLLVLALLIPLVIMGTMVYGPLAAQLVEMFPANIRYTSMSLPYHIGNGWFGGFLPTTAFAMVVATGNIYYGLWYPVLGAVAAFIIGVVFVREGLNTDIGT